MNEFTFVYMTAPDLGEATHISRTLVAEKLAACVNILPQMTSIYTWHNDIEESNEVVMLAKTRSNLFEALTSRVKALHSYSTPCIVALPITQGSPEFMQWLAAATSTSNL